jgi:hypothetical protein
MPMPRRTRIRRSDSGTSDDYVAPPGFLTFGAGGAQIALAIIAAGAIIGAAAASGMIAQKMTRSDQRRRRRR